MVTEFETTFTLEAIVAASLAVTSSAPSAVADWLVIEAAVREETLFVASTAPAAAEVEPKSPCCSVVDALEIVALIVAVVAASTVRSRVTVTVESAIVAVVVSGRSVCPKPVPSAASTEASARLPISHPITLIAIAAPAARSPLPRISLNETASLSVVAMALSAPVASMNAALLAVTATSRAPVSVEDVTLALTEPRITLAASVAARPFALLVGIVPVLVLIATASVHASTWPSLSASMKASCPAPTVAVVLVSAAFTVRSLVLRASVLASVTSGVDGSYSALPAWAVSTVASCAETVRSPVVVVSVAVVTVAAVRPVIVLRAILPVAVSSVAVVAVMLRLPARTTAPPETEATASSLVAVLRTLPTRVESIAVLTVPALAAATRTAPEAVTVETVAWVSWLSVVVTSRRPNSRKSATTVPVGLP